MFCVRENIDVLVLAESPFEGLLNVLDFTEAKTTLSPNAKTRCRLEIYLRNSLTVVSTEAAERAAFHELRAAASLQSFLLVSAHLDSDLSLRPETRKEKVRTFAANIRNRETTLRLSQTIVVGDLNYDPQDAALTDAYYLNAVPNKHVAAAKTRVLSRNPKIEVPYFYNPMWAHLTDRTTGPPGTYWYKTKDVDCRFWYLPDQILLRPDLLPFWNDNDLEIVHRMGKMNLLKTKGVLSGTPNRKRFSDHLPVVFSIDL